MLPITITLEGSYGLWLAFSSNGKHLTATKQTKNEGNEEKMESMELIEWKLGHTSWSNKKH